MGTNTISDLDSLFVGCTWYNADRNPSGTKPFNEYGFIIAFQAGGSNYFQIAIPFGALTHTPKWRSHVNNKWQNWRPFVRYNTIRFTETFTMESGGYHYVSAIPTNEGTPINVSMVEFPNMSEGMYNVNISGGSIYIVANPGTVVKASEESPIIISYICA